jgi:hypothetical protein
MNRESEGKSSGIPHLAKERARYGAPVLREGTRGRPLRDRVRKGVLTQTLKPVPFKDGILLFLELLSTWFAVIPVHQRGMEIAQIRPSPILPSPILPSSVLFFLSYSSLRRIGLAFEDHCQHSRGVRVNRRSLGFAALRSG